MSTEALHVVGLDLSLAATGMAEVWADNDSAGAGCRTNPSTGHRGDTLAQRRDRIKRLADRASCYAEGATLVVLEGPSIMSRGGSNWDRAWLWGAVVDELFRRAIPVAVAPPTVVKKWAADKGSADKAAVAAAMTRLWPGVHPGNDNEFDALALATMGAQRLGLDVPSRAHHAAALEKVEWPEPLRARGNGEPLEETK